MPQLVEPVLWDYGADLDIHSKGQYQNGACHSWAPLGFHPDKRVSQASQLHLLRACHSCFLLAHPALLVEKYRKSGFSWLWAASAFKGATGVNQSLTPIEHHLRNHLQWLQVAGSMPADTLRGIILTGWQR